MDIQPSILLVDDREENLTALEAVLQTCDARLIKAMSGNDALAWMLKEEFALILLDVQMPGMDGFEVAELMRLNPKTRHLPIVFITAISTTQDFIFKGYEVGAVDYLAKPVNPKILVSKVNIFLDLWRQQQKLAEALAENERFSRLLRRQAELDSLTGLPNRNLFHDRLQQAILESERSEHISALLFVDLDRFKPVNDSLGHDAGDDLLVQVGHRLKESVRKSDTVARIGGDEFTVLVKNLKDSFVVDKISNKILDAIARPFALGQEDVHISASIGITILPTDSSDPEELLKNADTAMYQAKSSGRNGFSYFNSGMNASAEKRTVLKSRLRAALDNNELSLCYQPAVDPATCMITGTDAMVFWNYLDENVIQADAFVHLAEEAGMPKPIRNWVLKTACEQNKCWVDSGLGSLAMRVNITPGQLADSRGLLKSLSEILEVTGLPPETLELEVAEYAVMDNLAVALATLEEVNALGVSVCLHGYGAGYASLARFKKIPIQRLKLHKAFIKNATGTSSDSSIVQAVIALAGKLSILVMAEAVDTQEQFAFLKAQGCHGMQGAYFSGPVPANELTDLLEKDKPFPHIH